MSPRPDVSAERKPQILQAALYVFLRKGFTAARMVDIARKAKLSVGNLYRYFDSKLDITLALMELFLSPSLQALEDLLSLPGTVRERLTNAFIDELAAQDKAAFTLYSEMYHLSRREKRIHKLLSAYNLRLQQQISALLQQGMERGELRPIDPASAAFTFQVIFDGMMQNLPLQPVDSDLALIVRSAFDQLFEGFET
ncbi:MAG: TetR/AcrR family transcriptional regulator [Chloroflexota bacterium]